MRITAKQLRKLIREAATSDHFDDHDLDHDDEYEYEDYDDDDSKFFLHGDEDGHAYDAEGSMAKYQLHRVKEISYMLCDMLEEDDQLPAWVQAHVTTAYENLNQVFSYMEPKMHMLGDDEDHDEDESEHDFEEVIDNHKKDETELDESLWANIHARRKSGKRPLKPGQKGYPKTLNIGKKKKKK